MKNIAIILASGTGSRCGLDKPKQFVEINGKTILEHTVNAFERNAKIDNIIVVVSEMYVSVIQEQLTKNNFKKVVAVVKGGETRKDSSYNGIFAINEIEDANVLIHDGARPLINQNIINKCIEALNTNDAICTTIESSDTIFVTNENGFIQDIPQRKNLKRAQTPQCFKLNLIKKAHELAKNDENCKVTDDCGLIMHYNITDIKTIDGDTNNIKITYPQDIEFAKKFLI